MDENTLINIIKLNLLSKLDKNAEINIIDETHKHKKHKGFIEGKRHFDLVINSVKLSSMSKINAHKSIYKALDDVMQYIHALSIKIINDKECKNA